MTNEPDPAPAKPVDPVNPVTKEELDTISEPVPEEDYWEPKQTDDTIDRNERAEPRHDDLPKGARREDYDEGHDEEAPPAHKGQRRG